MAALNIPDQDVSGFIRSLAQSNGVSAPPSRLDRISRVVTRLAGDDVAPDEIEGMLISLSRRGLIGGSDMVKLHSRYLDEISLSTGNP